MSSQIICCVPDCENPIFMHGFVVCKQHKEMMEKDSHSDTRIDNLYFILLKQGKHIIKLQQKIDDHEEQLKQLHHENQYLFDALGRLFHQQSSQSESFETVIPESYSQQHEDVQTTQSVKCSWCGTCDAVHGKTLCRNCFIEHKKHLHP